MAGALRVALAVKAGQKSAAPLVSRIVRLLRKLGAEVALDSEAARLIGERSGQKLEEIVGDKDGLIVFGGDGSMLAAVRAIGRRRVPVLGVNLGHLGFLTDVSPEEAESAVESWVEGRAQIVERTRFEVTHVREERELLRELVLNDAVITKGSALARLIELETRVDARVVATYRADGLIVATPTGSTAYNLSAGGPVLDPHVAAAIVNPICPHTLSLRPLVVPDSLQIAVRLRSSEDATLTLDGQVGAVLRPGDEVRVTRASEPALFVASTVHDPFETLRTRLGWGRR